MQLSKWRRNNGNHRNEGDSRAEADGPRVLLSLCGYICLWCFETTLNAEFWHFSLGSALVQDKIYFCWMSKRIHEKIRPHTWLCPNYKKYHLCIRLRPNLLEIANNLIVSQAPPNDS